MNRKKENEKLYLNFLMNSLQYSYTDLEDNKENPDFKLTINNERIGVELTRIFNITTNPPLMAIENEQRKIADKLLVLINKTGLPKTDIRLYFVPSKPFRPKTNINEYSLLLLNLIKNNFPKVNSQSNVKKASFLPRELVSISISRFDFIEENNVYSGKNGGEVNDFIDLLQSRIDKKNKKIDIYDKKCNEFWLLVYSDGSSGAAMFQPSEETLSNTFTSRFQRVLFISNINPHKTYELNLTTN